MKDLEGEHLEVSRGEYTTKDGTVWCDAVLIRDIEGYLVPLDFQQALQLARKLIKATL